MVCSHQDVVLNILYDNKDTQSSWKEPHQDTSSIYRRVKNKNYLLVVKDWKTSSFDVVQHVCSTYIHTLVLFYKEWDEFHLAIVVKQKAYSDKQLIGRLQWA